MNSYLREEAGIVITKYNHAKGIIGFSIKELKVKGINIDDILKDNNSYNALDKVNGLIKTAQQEQM